MLLKNKDKKKLEKFIRKLFDIYELNLYDTKYKNTKLKKGDFSSMINAVKNYCWANFSVDAAIQKYIHSPLMKVYENNGLKWATTFEKSLMKIKRYGKYFFTMFLGHYISINNERNFVEYLAYGTFDNKLIAIIEKTKNKDKWIKMVNTNQQNDEQNGKRFDKKWKDCETLVNGRKLKKENPFVVSIVEQIKSKKSNNPTF